MKRFQDLARTGLELLGTIDSYTLNSISMFILGALLQAVHKFFYWIVERIEFSYCTTAEFTQGDASFEWVLHLLTEEQIWHRSLHFRVFQKNSRRKWAVRYSGLDGASQAEYVPSFKDPILFRWNGYWVEVYRSRDSGRVDSNGYSMGVLCVSIFTLDTTVLHSFVETARERYKEFNQQQVTVHTASEPRRTRNRGMWTTTKSKSIRPLTSIVLKPGVVNSLVQDIREFLDSEDWYRDMGIPHRRGYLLHGPPGTGKTSTIYALAGALGMEIYSLSLSSHFMDDFLLEHAISTMSKNSILLIEDIDCAFPSRDTLNEGFNTDIHGGLPFQPIPIPPHKTSVSLSGLLNAIDGIGSDEGRVFFATTNYVDRLDSALLRPGRIDMQIQYHLSTKSQASALFIRFFSRPPSSKNLKHSQPLSDSEIQHLAEKFIASIPEHQLSTAELQGYLLTCKDDPVKAVEGAEEWVEWTIEERQRLNGERR